MKRHGWSTGYLEDNNENNQENNFYSTFERMTRLTQLHAKNQIMIENDFFPLNHITYPDNVSILEQPDQKHSYNIANRNYDFEQSFTLLQKLDIVKKIQYLRTFDPTETKEYDIYKRLFSYELLHIDEVAYPLNYVDYPKSMQDRLDEDIFNVNKGGSFNSRAKNIDLQEYLAPLWQINISKKVEHLRSFDYNKNPIFSDYKQYKKL